MLSILQGSLQAAIVAAFTYFVLKYYERKREKQVSQMLGEQVAQLIYWIWFFQNEGDQVRKKLDEGGEISRWITAMILDWRDEPHEPYLQDSMHAPIPAKQVIGMLEDLPTQLTDWQWRARRIERIAQTTYSLLSVANPKVSTELAESIARAELVTVDTLHSLDSAVAACGTLYRLAAAGMTVEDPNHLRSLLSSIDSGVIGVWRVMYMDTAQIWDRLHNSLRRLPAGLREAYDRVTERLSFGMKDHPPYTTDPEPKAIHPRRP
jgi:hypothetical protein